MHSYNFDTSNVLCGITTPGLELHTCGRTLRTDFLTELQFVEYAEVLIIASSSKHFSEWYRQARKEEFIVNHGNSPSQLTDHSLLVCILGSVPHSGYTHCYSASNGGKRVCSLEKHHCSMSK